MSQLTHEIFSDRIFWIYFIVTLFFIVIGAASIITSAASYMVTILILWILSNVALMIVTYHASINWGPVTDDKSLICVIDSNSGCFEPNNRIWLLVNVMFIVLLIISVLWAGELSNTEAGSLKSMSGVLILLGGLILAALVNKIPFWISLGYLLIWFGLTFYIVLTQ